MTPIDLVDYTRSSRKVSSEVLKISVPRPEMKISTWRILAAYIYDFAVVMAFTFLMSAVFEMAFQNLMMTKALDKAFNSIPFHTLTATLLPLMFGSYFFFSYFFNHGQTAGMKMFKARIEMPQLSFRASLLWAMFSASVMMTAGFSFILAYKWMQDKGWGQVKGHDHLYQWLMMERTLSPVNLVELTMATAAVEVQEDQEETYLRAA